MSRVILSCIVLGVIAGPMIAQTAPSAAKPAATTRPVVDERTPERKAADEYLDKCVKACMSKRWKDLKGLLTRRGVHLRHLSPEGRADLMYLTRILPQVRPRWWKSCRSTSNKSFKVKIWGRTLTANYIPSGTLGVQASIGIHRGKIQVIVSWRPNFIDSPRELKGTLAKKHGLIQGDIGEVVVWHELGHNYITSFLPLRHVITLYENHSMLFGTLQEFYADMTALYHCSPKARRLVMMFRLDQIETNRASDPHTRAALMIGSLLLSEFLSHPDKWPSVHFPPKTPDKEAERNTILYVFENFDKEWSLAEDRALRELVRKTIKTQGEKILRSKGRMTLPNKLRVRIMEPDDREYQVQRDQWVAERLKVVIDSGRADKAKPGATTRRSWLFRSNRIQIPW